MTAVTKPHTYWIKTLLFFLSLFQRSEIKVSFTGSKSRYSQGHATFKVVRGESFFWVWGGGVSRFQSNKPWLMASSCGIASCFSVSCLSLFVSVLSNLPLPSAYKDTQSYPACADTSGRSSHLNILKLIPTAKPLLKYVVTFTGCRDQNLDIFGCYCSAYHNMLILLMFFS